jgi:RecA-family ATPase
MSPVSRKSSKLQKGRSRRQKVGRDGIIFQQTSAITKSMDPAKFDGVVLPKREWLVPDLIPMKKVTSLYGDGGTGKTLLALQLGVAVAIGGDFLGFEMPKGKVYALLAENDSDDTHLTLHNICRSNNIQFKDLAGQMRISSRAGMVSQLVSYGTGNTIESDLLEAIRKEVELLQPKYVLLDNAAETFSGNESDRGQVSDFVGRVGTRIALETGAAVFLLAHPSVAGKASGTSGSTAWNNTVRSRLHLRASNEDENSDPNYRVLSLEKSNLSQRGTLIGLEWCDGVFVRDDPLQFRDRNNRHLEALVSEVERAFNLNKPWSKNHQAAEKYVVKWIQAELRLGKHAAEKLLGSALSTGKVVSFEYDAHRHRVGLATPTQQADALANKPQRQKPKKRLSR